MPILGHALRQVLTCPELSEVVVVAPPGCSSEVETAIAQVSTTPVRVVEGGAERRDSVSCGLAALGDDVDLVLVHDAARALTPTPVFERVVSMLRAGHSAVIPVLAVTDTIKQVAAASSPGELDDVVQTVDRSSLRAVQTPQGFTRDVLIRAHHDSGGGVTDDAGLVEAAGGTVSTVPGDVRSLKITTPHDLEVAALWLDPDERRPVLLVLGGLPGVGKTAIGRALAVRRGAAYLRIDTIEQALLRAVPDAETVGPEGYGVAQALSTDLLSGGLDVVADGTHRYAVIRNAWVAAAQAAGAHCVQVELTCSDSAEHQRRVETRAPDITGHRLPSWEAVTATDWEPWAGVDLALDTSRLSVDDAVAAIEETMMEWAVNEEPVPKGARP